ncbi:MAG: hypothetical protein V1874_06210 [Spirochaetota bacterium]
MIKKNFAGNIILPITVAALLFGLPLPVLILSGRPVERYLEFPPITDYARHAGFSWTAFAIFTVIILIFVLPIIIYFIKYLAASRMEHQPSPGCRLPWWGKLGIFAMLLFWIIAWGQFEIFGKIGRHTFFPLWLSFIAVVNSLQYARTGACLMTDQTRKFILLFPASSVFWWYFEYINGFTQNWYYVGADYSPMVFFVLSTIAFSTVLPAVSSINSLLLSFPCISKGFSGIIKVNFSGSMIPALMILVISCSALLLIGTYPDYLFPFVWVSPFLIIVSLQAFLSEKHIFSDAADGVWAGVVSAALAALVCGLFWEMWNFYSLPKWQYSVPLVHRFLIFEMPVLGFSGYLPFGLLCVSVSRMIGIRFE